MVIYHWLILYVICSEAVRKKGDVILTHLKVEIISVYLDRWLSHVPFINLLS